MPLYKYRAADAAGKSSDILIEGDTQADSLTRLRQRGYTPIRFVGQVESDGSDGTQAGLFSGKSFDVCAFTDRLSPLLRAQVQLERALGILVETTENSRMRGIIGDLRRGLHEGKKFSALIRDRGSCFPAFYANMIEAGEESGSLTVVVAELQKFLTERRRLKEFLIASSIYPVIILLVTGGVVGLLVTVFIPRFSKIFTASGKALPLPTAIMVRFSELATGLWWLWLLLFAGACVFVHLLRRGGRLRDWWDGFLIKVPMFGALLCDIDVTRFLRTMAVLTESHVHLLDAVGIAHRVLQNRAIKQSLAGISGELRGGSRLSVCLGKSTFVPKTVLQMVSIGEETGNLGGMLREASDFYEEAIRDRIKRLLALFEPAVILFLAGIVLLVVSSVFFAILELNKL
jgi:general secretion pathway protein F